MKIGFIYSGFRLSKGNGIVSQALTWKRILSEKGHEVIMCHPWEYNDYQSFDALQIFSFDNSTETLVRELYKKNKNLYVAPILDPDYSILNARLRSYSGISKLRLSNRFSALRNVRSIISGILVRSDFEKNYITQGFGYNEDKCHVVMLSNGLGNIPEPVLNKRKPFCFHMSFVTDARKNVKRLIDASVRYDFPLVLAGGIHFEHESKIFDSWINDKPNVKYLGYISEEEKKNLYQTAKVFALPSLNEGVGLVALEAASYGCDIVITELGGPKEYYGDLAEIVNPYDINSIGKGIKRLLTGKTYQPALADRIRANYSDEIIGDQLEKIYMRANNG